jgi:hypothetical protein
MHNIQQSQLELRSKLIVYLAFYSNGEHVDMLKKTYNLLEQNFAIRYEPVLKRLVVLRLEDLYKLILIPTDDKLLLIH